MASTHPEHAVQLTPRIPADSVDTMLADATERTAFLTADSKSGAVFERVVIDGAPFVVKYLHADNDWIMRALGDTNARPALAWTSGLLDTLPASIDHAILRVAQGIGRGGLGAALLMHDVGPNLVPEGDDPIDLEQHTRFMHHLAELCAHFWGWNDTIGLTPYAARWNAFGPDMLAAEAALDWPAEVPRIVATGWQRFAERSPAALQEVVSELQHDLSPFVVAMRTTPYTLLHGDWKMGNLGSHADGRTILLDWAGVGEGPACHDLVWYLALNRSRLPQTKEATIEVFRRALEQHGIDTHEWWDRQLRLCLLGGVIQFGWEKALGDDVEFNWWCERALDGAQLL